MGMQTSSRATKSVLLFSLFWALYIVQSKAAFSRGAQVIPFQLQTGLSALAALSLAMLPGVWRELRALFRRDRRLFWQLALADGLHYGVGGTLYILGVSLTTAVNAGFLAKFALVTTTLLAWIFLGERMSWRKAAAVLTMLLGVYLLTTQGRRILPHPGDLFILGACLAWSAGNILMRKGLRGNPVDPDLVTWLKPLAGLPLFGVFALLVGVVQPHSRLARLDGFSLPLLGYSVLAGVLLALTWLYLSRSLKQGTASYMTMLSTLTPVLVSVLAVLLLGETMSGVQILGGGLVVAAGVSVYFSDIGYR